MSIIDKVKVRAGRLIRVFNTIPKHNSKPWYISIWVEDADGRNERCLLFTENEIKRAEDRANKNKEDLTNKSLFTDLID
jgi:hypothetical protein